MRAFLVMLLLASSSIGAHAQDASPEGEWRDSFGTILRLSLCGDGTQLCGTLVDVQGESRTEANLSFVNRQIMQADQTGASQWQGSVTFGGNAASSTITQVAADTIEIKGCRVVFLCQTLAFQRIDS